MSTTPTATVAVLGLGQMGAALARAFLAAGHTVTVWNRSPTRTGPLAAAGARVAGSVDAAIAASAVTVACVTDHAATLSLLDRAHPADGARTLVQLSSMTPAESRALAGRARALGLGYLDGSILGLPSTVAGGQATILYSGPPALFEAAEPALRALGRPLHLGREVGAAVMFDRVWYAYSFGSMISFLQGAAMTHALGFPLEVYLEMVEARAPVLTAHHLELGAKIAARDYATADARLDQWSVPFADTLTLCRDHGVDDVLPKAVMEVFRHASAAGHGASDVAAVFEALIGRAASDDPA